MLIKNCMLIDGADIFEEMKDIRIVNGKIKEVADCLMPEGDEEIATPATQAQGAGIGPFSFKATAPETPIALKAGGAAGHGTQERIDQLAAAATKKSAGAFKKAFGPVLKIIEKAESLEELRDMMEDEKAVAELYAAMDVSEVEELLQKVMLYADLEGPELENG